MITWGMEVGFMGNHYADNDAAVELEVETRISLDLRAVFAG